ncbi:hypothetical protein NQ318_000501 [Aromia moschata]|uniref:Uncharacterized protein n=1 Tax=Aromia moschata TaxID=1265417 RepID=A0AAV8YFY7_9CUCU|nr:hypothetical protein NQ318_000501 [Aromia moschata]
MYYKKQQVHLILLMDEVDVEEDIAFYTEENKKLQVIEYFKNGMKNKDLSEKYKVHHLAISKIIHNKDKYSDGKRNYELFNWYTPIPFEYPSPLAII